MCWIPNHYNVFSVLTHYTIHLCHSGTEIKQHSDFPGGAKKNIVTKTDDRTVFWYHRTVLFWISNSYDIFYNFLWRKCQNFDCNGFLQTEVTFFFAKTEVSFPSKFSVRSVLCPCINNYCILYEMPNIFFNNYYEL